MLAAKESRVRGKSSSTYLCPLSGGLLNRSAQRFRLRKFDAENISHARNRFKQKKFTFVLWREGFFRDKNLSTLKIINAIIGANFFLKGG